MEIKKIYIIAVLKDAIRSTKFDNDDVIRYVRTSLNEQEKTWCRQDIHAHIPRWFKAVEVDETLQKNGVQSSTITLHSVSFSRSRNKYLQIRK
jgi:hypothetical protein